MTCRDCPAKVAKVSRRYPDRSPLRGAAWRRQLKYLATALLLVLAVMLVSAVTVALMPKRPGTTCAALIAGWHPDVPQKKCRVPA